MRLIGLTGAIGSGKSTVADILWGSYLFTEYAFKTPLVDALCRIFEVPAVVFIDRNLKTKPHEKLFGKTPREVMQSFGTDWGRNMISPDIWVKPVETLLNETQDNVVISDVRFESEAQMIKNRGGVIWKIERENNPFQDNSNHESENGIDSKHIDFVICNHGELCDLRESIDALIGYEIEHYYGA